VDTLNIVRFVSVVDKVDEVSVVTDVLLDEVDVLFGEGGVVGLKGALSVLDTVNVVDDVMLIRYSIKKSLGYSKKTS